MPKGPKPRPIAIRFWERVQFTHDLDACWPWIGHIQANGYATITTLGPGWPGYKRWLTHRLAYYLTHGEIPANVDIDHMCHDETCDRVNDCPHRRCCNPAHLRAVPHRTNVLRGNNFMAAKAKQTHCIHGHEFTEANTRIKSNGTRDCKACARAYQRARYHRLKET